MKRRSQTARLQINSQTNENQQTNIGGSLLHRAGHTLPIASGVDRGAGVDGVLMNFSRPSGAWRGLVRLGRAWHGAATRLPVSGITGLISHGSARRGKARRGKAWQGKHAYWRAVSPVNFSRRGWARLGQARQGTAWPGMATRLPVGGITGYFLWAWSGRGRARHGRARQGAARQGPAWQGPAWHYAYQ